MARVGYWNHNVHYQSVIIGAVPPGCGAALEVGCGDGLLASRLAEHPDQVPEFGVRPKVVRPGLGDESPHVAALLVQEEKATTPERIVDLLVELLLQGDVSPKARTKLIAFMAEGTPKEKNLNRRVRETIHAIMTMPEYQLA